MISFIQLFHAGALAVMVFALSACQHLPAGPVAPGDSPVKLEVRRDDVTLRAVLAYASEVSALDGAAFGRERKLMEATQGTPLSAVKLAVLLGLPRAEGDVARAAEILEAVLVDASSEAAVLHQLARILHAQYSARARLLAQNEELSQSQREARGQIESLQQKLDALTDIERSLPAPVVRPTETPQ